MGSKVCFNCSTYEIEVTEAPTLIDGEMVVEIDFKVDVYSDGKEDYTATPGGGVSATFYKHPFPIRSVGGDPLVGNQNLGASFFILPYWKIKPYEGNHVLRITGNVYSEDGTSPFTNTNGNYNVRVEQQVSNLVDTVTIVSGSGVTPQDKQDIADLVRDITVDTSGSTTLRQAVYAILASLAGIASGGGSTEITFRNQGNSANAVVMTVDENGNRSAVTIGTP
jgi:hypothetical protein